MPHLVLHLLGAPLAECDGAPMNTDTRKAIALVAYLAVTGATHTRDALAALLWPDLDQTRARAALRRTLSSIHSVCDAPWLLAERERIGLATGGAVACDVHDFQHALHEVRSHGHAADQTCERCLEPLERAAALYRDDFMAGFSLRDSVNFDDWQFFVAEGLRRDFAGALERLVNAYTARHMWREAIVHARRWLALDSLHEPAHRHLMLLYAWAGEHAAAVRQYQVCADVLKRELEVSPLPETETLFRLIRDHRIPPPPPRLEVAPPVPVLSDLATVAAGPPDLPQPPAWPLVGREAALAQLDACFAKAPNHGLLVGIEGEAGIGKSRLAQVFAAGKQALGASCIGAVCYEGEVDLAYAPVVQLLRSALALPGGAERLARLDHHRMAELRRLVPELPVPMPETTPDGDAPGARARLFEAAAYAIHRLLEGQLPGIVLIDDAQWADSASIDLLSYLVNRLTSYPLFVMLTLRTGEMGSDERLRRLIADAQRRHQGHLLALDRLDSSSVLQLVRTALIAGAEAGHLALPESEASRIAQQLFREAEGLPFFVVEYLEAMRADGRPLASGVVALPQPARVRDLLRSRLANVSEAAQQLVATAAVIGRSFDFETLRTASGRSDDEALSALDELLARGLVRELDDGDFDFSHEQLRAVVYGELSITRRRLLHRRVAEAISNQTRLSGRDSTLQSAALGHHYEMAGQPAEAARAYFAAGARAADLYANLDAAVHLRKAAGLGYGDDVALYTRLGDVETLLGNYDEARSHFTRALNALKAVGQSTGRAVGAIHHKLARVHLRQGETTHAAIQAGAALDAVSSEEHAFRSRVLADAGMIAFRQGEPERAVSLVRDARAEALLAEDMASLAQVQTVLSHLARRAGDHDEALEMGMASIALAEEMDDPFLLIAALNAMALAWSAAGNGGRAAPLLERALALVGPLGDRHSAAALHNNLADVFHQMRRSDDAMVHLKQAVAGFAEVGSASGLENPEIWKLAEW